MSEIPRTPWRKTSSATRNASVTGKLASTAALSCVFGLQRSHLAAACHQTGRPKARDMHNACLHSATHSLNSMAAAERGSGTPPSAGLCIIARSMSEQNPPILNLQDIDGMYGRRRNGLLHCGHRIPHCHRAVCEVQASCRAYITLRVLCARHITPGHVSTRQVLAKGVKTTITCCVPALALPRGQRWLHSPSSKRSLGMTMRVSTDSRSASTAAPACRERWRPSKENGVVTMPTCDNAVWEAVGKKPIAGGHWESVVRCMCACRTQMMEGGLPYPRGVPPGPVQADEDGSIVGAHCEDAERFCDGSHHWRRTAACAATHARLRMISPVAYGSLNHGLLLRRDRSVNTAGCICPPNSAQTPAHQAAGKYMLW